MERQNSTPAGNCRFAIPKKGRLFDKVVEMLKGAGIEFRREPRLDVALCVGLPITLVFLPAADIAKYVGEGNVDIGITGIDVVEESNVSVTHVLDLEFGKCKLCVQAPVKDNIKKVENLAGKRIVTSFPDLTKKYFKQYDEQNGVTTSVKFVSGSVEAACSLGLADAVVDLVETGTTMKVRLLAGVKSGMQCSYYTIPHRFDHSAGCRTGNCGGYSRDTSCSHCKSPRRASGFG
jgi:ATP phosphoribosyltransferase